jgi:serine/threonine protein kinase
MAFQEYNDFGYNRHMQKFPCPVCGDLLTPGILCPKDRSAILGPDIRVEKKYTLGAKLGMNTIGEVWSAKDPNHKILTLRFLRAKLGPEALERWQTEVRAVNQIHHRNLQEIFAFGRLPDKTPYCVAEMLDGESLKDFLRKYKVIPTSGIEHVMGQVCRALQAVHERKMAHFNMKPSNIFLVKTRDAHLPLVKILDFGTSHFSEQDANAIFRAPAYLSPEQCAGSKNIDHRSDLYTLGIVLFEMLTGQTPFATPGANAGLIVAQHINGPIPKLSQFSKDKFPGALDKFMAQALAKDPAQRFQSATDFYNKLTLALALPKEGIKVKAAAVPPRPNNNVVVIGVGVLVMSIVFTAVLLLLLGPSTPEEPELPKKIELTSATKPTSSSSQKPASIALANTKLPENKTENPKGNPTVVAVDSCKACPGNCVQGKCQAAVTPDVPKCDEAQCIDEGGICRDDICAKPQPKVQDPPNVPKCFDANKNPVPCWGSTTDTGPKASVLLEQAKNSVMQGDCETGLQTLADYQKKAGSTADYYWYKAYCYSDTVPIKACKAYKSFLAISPKGSQAEKAKSYLAEKAAAGIDDCD